MTAPGKQRPGIRHTAKYLRMTHVLANRRQRPLTDSCIICRALTFYCLTILRATCRTGTVNELR